MSFGISESFPLLGLFSTWPVPDILRALSVEVPELLFDSGFAASEFSVLELDSRGFCSTCVRVDSGLEPIPGF